MPVVTVSRMLGTTGDQVAEGIALALGSRLVTKSTIFAAAQASGLSPITLADLDGMGRTSLTDRLLAAVRIMPTLPRSRGGSLLDAAPLPVAHEGFLPQTPTQHELDQGARRLEEVIRTLAASGDVVIVGRAAHAILAGHPDAFHVQVVAPLAYRVKTLGDSQGLNVREALARLRASDSARADYVRRYYNMAWTDATNFDLVLNAARLDVATAIHLIVTAIRLRS